MTSNIVQYGSYSLDAVDDVDKQVNAIASSSYMDLVVGENVVRFLPPPLGAASPFRVSAMHYVDAVPGLDKTVVFACPRHELQQHCIVCEKVEELGHSRNPIDRERAYRMKASLRIFANVIDRGNQDAGPRILGFSKQIYGQLRAIRKSPRLGGDFTDPSAAGFDVIIVREGTGKNDTKYTVSADRNNCPLSDDAAQVADWIDRQHDLELCVDTSAPEKLILAWQGLAQAGRATGAPALARGPQRSPARSAIMDAQGVSVDDDEDGVEYDEDFNPVIK